MGSLLHLCILFQMLRVFIGRKFYNTCNVSYNIYTLQLHIYYIFTCISKDKK